MDMDQDRGNFQGPEKMRFGVVCESEEEEELEDDDIDFYEGDSDYDINDDFTYKGAVDEGFWKDGDEAFPFLDEIEKKEDRGCLANKSVCNMYQHKSEFDGLLLFELFKVKLKLNDKVSTDPLEGPLCGAIELYPPHKQPVPISYYWVSEKQPDFIHLNTVNNMTLLPLSGPQPRPPIADCHSLALSFSFKFDRKDVLEYGLPRENPELFDDGCGIHTAKHELMCLAPIKMATYRLPFSTPFITRRMIGDPDSDSIIMAAYYTMYFGAWATVHVQMLKKGVRSCSGFIYARPCIFSSRIRLLSSQSNQKLEEFGYVKIGCSCSILFLPHYCSCAK